MDKRADLIMALVVLGFGVWYYYLASQVREGMWEERIGAGFFPSFLAICTIIFGIWLVATRILKWRREAGRLVAPEGDEDIPGYPISHSRVFLITALGFAYIFIAPYLGYLLTAPPFFALGLIILGVRNWKPLAGTALGLTLVLYLVFVVLLGVQLPTGPLPRGPIGILYSY